MIHYWLGGGKPPGTDFTDWTDSTDASVGSGLGSEIRVHGSRVRSRIAVTFLGRALDLLYPRLCGLCGAAGEPICADCDAKILWSEGETCPACGGVRQGSWCGACSGKSFEFRRAVALGAYSGTLRDAVLALKFKGERSLAGPLSRRLAERIRMAGFPVDAVAFVPMSRWKMLVERRVNAAELLAEGIARELDRPLTRLLRKIRRTRAQTALPLGERLENPREAYRAGPGVADRAVLLVDDVLTTGATASACAKALTRARAREVSVAVIARSQS